MELQQGIESSGTFPDQPTKKQFALEFHGTGSEYFRIWIVNISLTILTLGIYSAWAKVRKMQYFYGNSQLAGGTFEFTANPINILKGRVLVFGLFIAYQLASVFQPVLALVLAVIFIPFIPWVIIKAISFNLRYSSYRGLHFHFDGQYWEAFRVYVLLTLAIPLSLGFAYPWVAWRRKQFFVDNTRYGTSSFGFSGAIGHFYTVYVVGWLIMSGIALAVALLIAAAAFVGPMLGLDPKDMMNIDGEVNEQVLATIGVVVGIVAYGFFILAFLAINTGILALIANHVWQRTTIAGSLEFNLDLNAWKIVGIQITNILAIIFSVGLAIPWTTVRMVRYKASRFTMIAAPSTLESFIASERDSISATGTELGDAMDLNLGI
ncbi:MAG: uncharacterized membrane protein YjgN (DUF898 family) [Gammaproteobacteria bacterium]|jgi:uncharacterized membrane protein YjgN (DUF898 family)